MNQTRKNVWSTGAKPTQIKVSDTMTLHGKNMRDIYTKVYDGAHELDKKECALHKA